jgi:error-prone DNA polymerase
VLQWDKDDCADAGLVKFDLLGLGMLTALDHALRLTEEVHGDAYGLATLPQEDAAVYDMLCAADSVGVFQVESRAQMSTLPRLRPRRFYDLVVEVALVRPGPIQGGSVHPYIRRKNKEEEVTFLHPRLERSLGKTLGVPLFQEQLMQMAVDVADFTPAEADRLRRAMGSKRSTAKMIALKERLFAGMAGHGIDAETGERIFAKMLAFANYGFPESHAYSFAYLVYASSLLKCYYPAVFCAALLRSQPMGFYSPQSLVADARRHGVIVRGVDLNASPALSAPEVDRTHRPYRFADVAGTQVRGAVAALGPALRLGLEQVRGISRETAEAIATERDAAGPYASASDLARRVQLTAAQLDALATAGALDSLQARAPGATGETGGAGATGGAGEAAPHAVRRAALWGAGAAAKESPATVPGVVVGTTAPVLPGMTDAELAAAGAWATGITVDDFPTEHVRPALTAEGVLTSASLRQVAQGTRVEVGGVVTHRQRPGTAGGTTFLGMEDETGLLNVVVSPGLWAHQRDVLRGAPALVVRGIVENANGAVNLIADRVRPLPLPVGARSRDFR